MKKEELEAIFGDGENTPDTGPIEIHLHALATERKLPDFAVGMCLLRIEESAPTLRAVLSRAAEGESLSDDDSLLLFRGVHILGAARDRATCQPLLRLLRRAIDEIDALLGDAVTENLAKIITGVFDGDVDALLEPIMDRSVEGFIREALFGAATFLTWERRIERDRFRDFLVRFHEEQPANNDDPAWAGWAQAIALLGLRDLVPLAHRAIRDGRVPDEWTDLRQFDEDIARCERAPDDIERFTEMNRGYIEDVTTSLKRFSGGGSGYDEKTSYTDFYSREEPVRNPWRHVGRNDPCPCGSGKKFKKCCLASGGPPA